MGKLLVPAEVEALFQICSRTAIASATLTEPAPCGVGRLDQVGGSPVADISRLACAKDLTRPSQSANCGHGAVHNS